MNLGNITSQMCSKVLIQAKMEIVVPCLIKKNAYINNDLSNRKYIGEYALMHRDRLSIYASRQLIHYTF